MAVEIVFVEGGVCAPKGFRAGSAYAGIRKVERDDVAVIVSEHDANAAGVFTRNAVKAWCVRENARRLHQGMARGIVCNAGNANACNGEKGRAADEAMAEAATTALLGPDHSPADTFLTASTGVIGRALPVEKAKCGAAKAIANLIVGADGSKAAAKAIMTTDLVSKETAVEVITEAGAYRIGGIAKGSGMIAPNMATMLAFLTTDAQVDSNSLDAYLKDAVEKTFNCVTVDGDTSTNDLALILANGDSGILISEGDSLFAEALATVCERLAKMIARDGEGATKLVEVNVTGCKGDAKRVARTIAESPLVKTALFGNDPNWGRVLMAAGRSGEPVHVEETTVWLAGHKVFEKGLATDADPDAVSRAMRSEDVEIRVDLGWGDAGTSATMWTCDYSFDYVKINAEYTT